MNNRLFKNLRNTNAEVCVVMNKSSFDDMIGEFDSIFGNILDYKDQIASVRLIPINLIESDTTIGRLYVDKKTVPKTIKCFDAVTIDTHFNVASFEIKEYFHNFLDYKGYTYIQCYLPYLGWIDIDPNEVMADILRIELVVDYYTATGIYILSSSRNGIFSTFEVNLGSDIPIGNTNAGEVARNMILGGVKIAATIGTAIASKSIPSSTTITTKKYGTREVKSRPVSKANAELRINKVETHSPDVQVRSTSTNRVPSAINTAINGSVDALNRNFPSSRSDRSNNPSALAFVDNRVILKIYRPAVGESNVSDEIDKYRDQDSYSINPLWGEYLREIAHAKGRPLGAYRELNTLSGFTSMSEIHLKPRGSSDIVYEQYSQMTQEELVIIENELKSGVYINITPDNPT